jgi:hypothetical protein
MKMIVLPASSDRRSTPATSDASALKQGAS